MLAPVGLPTGVQINWFKVDEGSTFNRVVLISRFFQQDEEMLILTHSDELNRTYGEDSRLPFDNIADRNNTSSDDTRRNRTLFQTQQDNPSVPESTSTLLQESPALKETRATVISTGPRTMTITSAVATPCCHSLWFKNTNGHGKGRRSLKTDADKMGSNSEQNNKHITKSWKMFCHRNDLILE